MIKILNALKIMVMLMMMAIMMLMLMVMNDGSDDDDDGDKGICHDVDGGANDYDGNDVTLMVMDEDDDGNSGGGGGGSSGSRVWQGYIFPIGSLLPAEDERKSSCICRLP